jgi:peptidoglycan/LPS O-acetylase OafA/YrhL
LKRTGGLDLVRFGAAVLVMLFHLTVVSWNLPGLSPNYGIEGAPRYPEFSFLSIGWVGVEIFFVLSGLVIAQSANGKSAYRFLRNRLGRLLPAVWVCSTILIVVAIYFDIEPSDLAFRNYLRSVVIHRNGPWISGVFWTLAVETFFYAAIFLMLCFNAFKYIEKFAILLGIYSSIYLSGVVFFGWHHISKHFLAQHGCFFSLGILIWLCTSKGLSFVRLLFFGIFLVAGSLEICMIANGSPLVGYELWAAPCVWLASVGAICIFEYSRVDGNHLTSQLGLITYPLYLLHDLFGSVILRSNPWVGRLPALALAVTTTIALSWLVLQIEPVIRSLIEKVFDWISNALSSNRFVEPLLRNTSKV